MGSGLRDALELVEVLVDQPPCKKAVEMTFADALIQRCQVKKMRNIIKKAAAGGPADAQEAHLQGVHSKKLQGRVTAGTIPCCRLSGSVRRT